MSEREGDNATCGGVCLFACLLVRDKSQLWTHFDAIFRWRYFRTIERVENIGKVIGSDPDFGSGSIIPIR